MILGGGVRRKFFKSGWGVCGVGWILKNIGGMGVATGLGGGGLPPMPRSAYLLDSPRLKTRNFQGSWVRSPQSGWPYFFCSSFSKNSAQKYRFFLPLFPTRLGCGWGNFGTGGGCFGGGWVFFFFLGGVYVGGGGAGGGGGGATPHAEVCLFIR